MASCETQVDTKSDGDSLPAADRPSRSKGLMVIRRLHMYLGIALVPWFFMYAIGAFVLNHRATVDGWFRQDKPQPETILFDHEFHRPLPSQEPRGSHPDAMRSFALDILQENGLGDRSFWFNQPNDRQLNITAYTFLKSISVIYFIDQGRLVGKEIPFNVPHFFIGMHERGGFAQAPWLTKAWGGIVDLVGVAVLAWAISGLYVWWKVHRRHVVGGLVLAAGAITFIVLVKFL